MRVYVEKTSSNKVGYKTPLEEIDFMPHFPVVGECLLLISSSHKSGGIVTSKVLEVKNLENGYEVKTTFSTYIIKKRNDE